MNQNTNDMVSDILNSTINTCRFCKGVIWNGKGAVHYAIRHDAHFSCYLDAGKSLEDLTPWQVGQFPWKVLREYGLMSLAETLTKSR